MKTEYTLVSEMEDLRKFKFDISVLPKEAVIFASFFFYSCTVYNE